MKRNNCLLAAWLLGVTSWVGCCCHNVVAQQNESNKDSNGINSVQSTPAESLLQSEDSAESLAPPSAAGSDSDGQRQRVFDFLLAELDAMIPGELVDGSEQKKLLEAVVKSYQSRDGERVNLLLKDLQSKSTDFPPAKLLIAVLQFATQDTTSGLAMLEQAAIDAPDYPGIYLAFGRWALMQGRLTDALALLEKCDQTVEQSKLSAEAKAQFKLQCCDGLIEVAMRQSRFEDAKALLDQVKDEDGTFDVKHKLVAAELAFRDDQLDESLQYLRSIKEKYPNARTPELVIANWFEQSKKTTEAEKWYREAAEKFADDGQVQLQFAAWCVNREDFAAASRAIAKAEKILGESLVSRELKAKIAFCNQSYGVAETHYQVISQQQPNNFDAVNMYALTLVESSNPEKRQQALGVATQNLQSLPDSVIAQASLGYIQLKTGNVDQAKQFLGQAIRSPGLAPEINYFLACLLAETGDGPRAKMVAESALDYQGIFLYRKATQQLVKKLEEQKEEDQLPTP